MTELLKQYNSLFPTIYIVYVCVCVAAINKEQEKDNVSR